VNLLLDTHTLLWSVIHPENLSRTAATLIGKESNGIFVSAASAWEIATKVRLKKLPGAEAFERDFFSVLQSLSYTLMPISAEDALRAGRLPAPQGDPFDRMIAAQALTLDIPILSKDPQLDQFGIRRIW
jgi:PIN domain nuclease of toxin-antitoxin system